MLAGPTVPDCSHDDAIENGIGAQGGLQTVF